jgi:hypothetical protein
VTKQEGYQVLDQSDLAYNKSVTFRALLVLIPTHLKAAVESGKASEICRARLHLGLPRNSAQSDTLGQNEQWCIPLANRLRGASPGKVPGNSPLDTQRRTLYSTHGIIEKKSPQERSDVPLNAAHYFISGRLKDRSLSRARADKRERCMATGIEETLSVSYSRHYVSSRNN